MRLLPLGLVVAVVASAVLVLRADAGNQSPTSSATPSPSVVPASPSPSATFPLQQSSRFHGIICVDLDCHAGLGSRLSQVEVRIGGVSCGLAIMGIVINGASSPIYEVNVPSADLMTGCGTEGAEVEFFNDGEQARPNAVWRAGQSQYWPIYIGPDFAAYRGELRFNGGPWRTTPLEPPVVDRDYPDFVVTRAYVGETQCGEDKQHSQYLQGREPGAPFFYGLLIVPVDSSRPGCGASGTTVRFTVNGLPADQTAIWSPGFRELNLNVNPAQLPDTGGKPAGASGVPLFVILLAAVATTAAAGAVTVRLRA